MKKRTTPEEYLEESKQGKWCAVVGCFANPSEKCPICGAHYCNEHIKTHFHVVEKRDEKMTKKTILIAKLKNYELMTEVMPSGKTKGFALLFDSPIEINLISEFIGKQVKITIEENEMNNGSEKQKREHIVTEIKKISKDWFRLSYSPVEWFKKYPDNDGFYATGVTKKSCPIIEKLKKGDLIVVTTKKGKVIEVVQGKI